MVLIAIVFKTFSFILWRLYVHRTVDIASYCMCWDPVYCFQSYWYSFVASNVVNWKVPSNITQLATYTTL